MRNIAIYGAGGFGREVLTILHDNNKLEEKWNVLGFFDDGKEKGEIINGYKVLGGIQDLNTWPHKLSIVVALGAPSVKKDIIQRITNPRIEYPTIFHSSAIIGDNNTVKIGKGCIICAYNIITTNVIIGDFVILNLSCTIGHDTTIGEYSSFMPTCNISGEVNIGECVFGGTGSKIINRKNIGNHSTIGAGAVVIKDVPDNAVLAGVPAKVIKLKE